MMKQYHKAGFTLVELSIVLVIIGLIVGGVLVGSDLINAAKIRATVSQLDQYRAAVNTFEVKYNALPGDLNATQAAQLGFSTRPGTVARGNGDGIIENQSAASGYDLQYIGGEAVCFWDDLSNANLLNWHTISWICPITMTLPDGTADVYLNSIYVATGMFPTAKLGDGFYWEVYSNMSTNYYLLSGINYKFIPQMFQNILTPHQAYGIDSKIDDGLPQTGAVRALSGTVTVFGTPAVSLTFDNFSIPASPAAGVCVSNATGNPYNVISSFGSTSACQLRLSF